VPPQIDYGIVDAVSIKEKFPKLSQSLLSQLQKLYVHTGIEFAKAAKPSASTQVHVDMSICTRSHATIIKQNLKKIRKGIEKIRSILFSSNK
jgi:hypothetical protein